MHRRKRKSLTGRNKQPAAKREYTNFDFQKYVEILAYSGKVEEAVKVSGVPERIAEARAKADPEFKEQLDEAKSLRGNERLIIGIQRWLDRGLAKGDKAALAAAARILKKEGIDSGLVDDVRGVGRPSPTIGELKEKYAKDPDSLTRVEYETMREVRFQEALDAAIDKGKPGETSEQIIERTDRNTLAIFSVKQNFGRDTASDCKEREKILAKQAAKRTVAQVQAQAEDEAQKTMQGDRPLVIRTIKSLLTSKQPAVALNAARDYWRIITAEELPLEEYTVEELGQAPTNVVNMADAAAESLMAKAEAAVLNTAAQAIGEHPCR